MASTQINDTAEGYQIGSAPDQKIGLFGATPVVQPTALTALTDETTGTPDGTLELVGDTTSNQAVPINKNFAELGARFAALEAKLAALGAIAAPAE